MLFPPRKKPRRFSYTPQYSNDKNEGEDKEKRIKFRRVQRRPERRGFSLWIIILAIFVIFLMYFLMKIAH